MVIDEYGGSDKLQLRELPDPTPKAGELLVRVRAASVNPADWKIAEGGLRLVFPIKFPYTPGGDVAGEVVAVGPGVTQFKAGDQVVAFVDLKQGGGYAELAVVKASATALKANSLSFIEAASLPIAAGTALQALRDKGQLLPGQSILINGGAGGVGHFAVQIAKAFGANVSATCGTNNVEFVKSLGTDVVIDYAKQDFTQGPGKYRVIFDAVGKSSFAACRSILEPTGIYVTTLPKPGVFVQMAVQSIAGLFGKTQRASVILAQLSGADLATLGHLADHGKLKPTIGATYRLDQVAQAWQESQKGHARGKIVIEV
jgi:2-desacetyl-2-hydroxyethyl bacteriochlorophyllide A dehydrogenase